MWKPAASQCKSNTKSHDHQTDNNNDGDMADSGDIEDSELRPSIHENVDDDEINNIIEGAARSKVSRSSATETMGLSGAQSVYRPAQFRRQYWLLPVSIIWTWFTLRTVIL